MKAGPDTDHSTRITTDPGENKMKRYKICAAIAAVSIFALIFASCNKISRKDTMLIYFGMEYVDDGTYPIFEYYYPSREFENTDLAHLVMVYKGDYKYKFKYGDIVTPSIPIDVSSFDLNFRQDGYTTYNPYADYHELDPATEFSFKGNIYRDMEKKTLIVTNERYWTDYEGAFTTLTMKDSEGKTYSYSYLWRNPEEGRPDILNNEIGDSIDFAIYKNNAIMILSNGEGLEKGDLIVPDVNTPFDEEEFFILIGQEGGYPVFEYYTPDNSGEYESIASQPVFYRGSLPQDLKYGDVFISSEKNVNITRGRNIDDNSHEREYRISYELDQATRLEYIGNGFEIMPRKNLVLGSVDYIGFDLFSCNLVEPDYTAYYTYDYYSTVNEVNLDNFGQGKTVEFICYRNRLILPARP